MKIVSLACRISKWDQSDLLSGLVGDLAKRYLDAKFEVLAPAVIKRALLTDGRTEGDRYSSAELSAGLKIQKLN